MGLKSPSHSIEIKISYYQTNIAKSDPDFIKPAKNTLFNNSLNSTGFNQQAVVVGIDSELLLIVT